MNDLSLSSDKENFLADIDKISVSTFGLKLFYGEKIIIDLDQEKEKEVVTPVHLEDDSISNQEDSSIAQTITCNNDEIQDSIAQDS